MAACSGFGVSEHYTDLLSQLVDKNTGSIGLADIGCKLA